MTLEEYAEILRADIQKGRVVADMMATDGWAVFEEALAAMAETSQQLFLQEKIDPERHRAEMRTIQLMQKLGYDLAGNIEGLVAEFTVAEQKIEQQGRVRRGYDHLRAMTRAGVS